MNNLRQILSRAKIGSLLLDEVGVLHKVVDKVVDSVSEKR